MRGLTEHEAAVLRAAVAARSGGYEGLMAPEDYPVLVALHRRGCLERADRRSPGLWEVLWSVTELGRIALRVQDLALPPAEASG